MVTSNTSSRDLFVVPRRSLIEPLASDRVDVWTFEELLERVRLLAFAGNLATPLRRNDDARFWGAAFALSQGRSRFAPRMANDLARLSFVLTDEEVDTQSVLGALSGSAGRPGEVRDLLLLAAQTADRSHRAGYSDRSAALRQATVRLSEGAPLPASLTRYNKILIWLVVEPSPAELQCIIELARRGIHIEYVLPRDEHENGFASAVRWIEETLHTAHDVDTLTLEHVPVRGDGPTRPFLDAWLHPGRAVCPDDTPVSALLCGTPAEEARRIAGRVSALFDAHPDETPRIGVLLRSIDGFADMITDELAAYGISARRRDGRPLAEIAAGQVLLDLLGLRQFGAPRQTLLSLLVRPAYARHVDVQTGAAHAKVLRAAVARRDDVDQSRSTGGFEHRINRYLNTVTVASEREAVEKTREVVATVLADAARIPARAPLLTYLSVMRALAEDVLVGDDETGATAVLDALIDAESTCRALAADRPVPPIDLGAFARLLERFLTAAKTRAAPVYDTRAVELLSLPGALGLRFDHVIIGDCVQGRLPLQGRPDQLLSEADKALVNETLGRRVFRIDALDTMEVGPVAPRQALELFWFVHAAGAADKSLLLTASGSDARGRERATSDYFEAARVALRDGEGALWGAAISFAPHPREHLVNVGRRFEGGSADVEPHLRAVVDMQRQRRAFFSDSARTAPYAFGFGTEGFTARFNGLLGVQEGRPLTPTRIEALAQCAFRGTVEHLLGIDTHPEAGEDADARVLGRLAHRVLERFYQERKEANVDASRFNEDDEQRLLSLCEEEADARGLLSGNHTGHAAALRASVTWLAHSLVRTVQNLSATPPVPGTVPNWFERNIGVNKKGGQPYDAPAVPLHVAERTLYFGGEIDRIDRSLNEPKIAVVDYKNATSDAVRQKVYSRRLFTSHFQLPLYLRLVAHHSRKKNIRLAAYLISLKDGMASDVLDDEDFQARVMDDDRERGLSASLTGVLAPLFEGEARAVPGYACRFCRCARLCRKDDVFGAGEPDG